ncbi:hypothetical protein EES41_00995 [Streptomyces sp. ADI95-16]|uniref:hypothetical protein n=1 Tax=Streptomyces sp. ADI95-16 TaxID=1522758 RepID=UPI000F4319ED|nr:hypothetical protein EES41_00995 [Streptomyces sp. ADI95-16]
MRSSRPVVREQDSLTPGIRLRCADEQRTVPFGTGGKDWLIAIGVAAALLVTGVSGQHSVTGLDLLGYVLLVSGGLVPAAGRRAPVSVLAGIGFHAVGYQTAGFDVAAVAYLFAVYAAMSTVISPSPAR